MRHITELEQSIPNLCTRSVLDVGSGKGRFLVEMALRGATAHGLELNPAYIRITDEQARDAGVEVTVSNGKVEKLPFNDGVYGFINASEVIEHVEDPVLMLRELHRVLEKDGYVYLSVPNRFGMKDPHFNLYFVNWLPRSLCSVYISLFGAHKEYTQDAGEQRLDKMHYYTFSDINKLLLEVGFEVEDIRMKKIHKKYGTSILHFPAVFTYRMLRPFYFDTFHLLLRKV